MHSTRVFAAVAAVALLASVANSTIIDCTPAGAIASGLKVGFAAQERGSHCVLPEAPQW